MVGFERLYKEGQLAVVHGCGYDHPSLSHFSSMGFWHTGVPNGGEPLGWLGRLADERYAQSERNVIVNIGSAQSLAVRSGRHSPLVFDDPARFRREGTDAEKSTLEQLSQTAHDLEPDARVPVARPRTTPPKARTSCAQASASYRTPVDYGIGGGLGGNLQRVAALIAAEHADAALLRQLRRQLVRHPRAAGGSAQPPADVHRRRGARLHEGHGAHRPRRARWRW